MSTWLPRVPYVQDVSILHDVVLALESQNSLCSGVGFGAGFQQLVPANGFCANEMLFQIGMDRPGSLDRARIHGNGPGAAFVFADSEKRHQAEEFVALADQPRQAALLQAVTCE